MIPFVRSASVDDPARRSKEGSEGPLLQFRDAASDASRRVKPYRLTAAWVWDILTRVTRRMGHGVCSRRFSKGEKAATPVALNDDHEEWAKGIFG